MKLKENSALISLGCVVLLFALIYFVFRPLLAGLNSANVDLKTKKTELSQKEAKLENLKELKTKIASLQATLLVMQKALPKGEDLPSLLVSTESLVGSSGLSLGNFTPPNAASSASGSAPTASTQSTTQTGSSTAAVGEETTGGTATAPSAGITPAVSQASGIAATSYSLTLTGSYGAFLTFLDNVNKDIRPTVVNSIDLKGANESISISLKMSSYYQK